MFRQEIGGDFHICEGNDHDSAARNVFEYLKEYSALYFDSGRSALKSLLKQIKCRKALLPGYICESVRESFPDGCDVQYYRVTRDIKIDWNDLLDKAQGDVDIVYLHFFNGYIGKEYNFDALLRLKAKHKFTIVEDTTHSFFTQKRTVGDYCVCSLRKWFPIADGGVLYSKNIIETEDLMESKWASSKREAMLEKHQYLQGLSNDKKHFLASFSNAECTLDSQKNSYAISRESYNALKRLDCDFIMSARKRNFNYLKEKMNCEVVASGGENQIPIFFTIRDANRDALRQLFIQNDIYCPIHWPLYGELQALSEAVSIYGTELSIPIDQRYGKEEMERICRTYYDYFDGRKKT